MLWLALVGLACKTRDPVYFAETDWIQDISVEQVTDMPTAMRVRFTTPEAGQGWVEFGDDFARTSPVSASGTTHEVIVLGAPPLSDVSLRAVVEVDGERHESGVFEAESGQLPIAVPLLDVTQNSYSVDASSTLLMSVYDNEQDDTVVMATLDGDIFWATPQADGSAFGLSVQATAGGLWFNRFQDLKDGSIEGQVVRTDQWGNEQEVIETPGAHHYFTRVGDDTYWLRNNIEQVSGIGQVIIDEIMVTDASGESRVLLNLGDVLEIQESEFPQDIYDWSHANWLDYNPDRNTLLICAGFINTILEVTLDGEVVDIFGGLNANNGSYSFDPPAAAFDIPHGVHWAENGDLLMFAADDETRSVQALRFEVDTEAKVLRRVWSYGASKAREPMLLGEVKELSDGNILINWGSWGHIQIVSPEGELLWEAFTEFLVVPGQVDLIPSPYL